MPTGGHEDLSGKVINLIRRSFGKSDFQRDRVAHVTIQDFNLVLDMIEPAHGSGLTTHQAVDAISEIQEVFGKIAAVLPGNAGDQGLLHNQVSPSLPVRVSLLAGY